MLLSYDGNVLPRVRMMGHVRYSEPWMHFSRQIDEFVLYVIREGNMYIKEDGVKYRLAAGDFFLLEPGLLHEGFEKATCDYYYAHFSHSALKRAKDPAAAMEELAEKRRKTMISYNLDFEDPTDSITYIPKQFNVSSLDFRKVLSAATEEYDAREEHYRNRVSATLHSFLLNVAHEHLLTERSEKKKITKAEYAAERLIRYMNQNYSKPFSGSEIEEMFEVNFDYINRIVAKMTGYTVFAYLNGLRINNAKQLIATTDLPFNEIAYYVGIEDRYYFSKLFKKLTGMTATEYYRRARER